MSTPSRSSGVRSRMGIAVLGFMVLCCCLDARAQSSQQGAARSPDSVAVSTKTVSGVLTDLYGPITDAEVYLQSFEDEECAKLFTSTTKDIDSQATAPSLERLRSCMHDLAPVVPNERGAYAFKDLEPGWYAMRFLWRIAKTPRDAPAAFKRGPWVILFPGYLDKTGRFTAMAQGKPFYFSGSKHIYINFDYERPHVR